MDLYKKILLIILFIVVIFITQKLRTWVWKGEITSFGSYKLKSLQLSVITLLYYFIFNIIDNHELKQDSDLTILFSHIFYIVNVCIFLLFKKMENKTSNLLNVLFSILLLRILFN